MFRLGIPFRTLSSGDPGSGLWMLILSMIVYGMAFDFFNISAFHCLLNKKVLPFRASAQGLFFMMMTNGLGAIIGLDMQPGALWWTPSRLYADGMLVSREWPDIWLIFCRLCTRYRLLFALVFKYKHQLERIKTN